MDVIYRIRCLNVKVMKESLMDMFGSRPLGPVLVNLMVMEMGQMK